MSYLRYWAMTLGAAICGGFIAIDRFAFAPHAAVWVAFGVAIAATVFSIVAFGVALARDNHAFSGLGAFNVLIAAWTIIAMRVFRDQTAIWLAFASGVTLLLVSLRALALHETTIERVVHALERSGATTTAGSTAAKPLEPAASTGVGRHPLISAAMHSWMYWLTHTGLVLAGAFVVLMSFALTAPGTHHASLRWIVFGVGIAATCAAFGAVLERSLARRSGEPGNGGIAGRLGAIALTGFSLADAITMIVTMLIYTGTTARWIAFALGCALVGASLLAYLVHEITSERVRHELEIAEPAPATRPVEPVPAA